ncbi:MAG: ATP-dependent zinc metalloprotease FtsH [Chlamydiae bacterium]|nr:ATP-dependent zinc metalloprotease FtsH [Chlamydiota bacterium]
MSQDMKPEKKGGFSGSFILLLIAAVFVILTIQNLSDVKSAPVSFSYQLEHLHNLQLVKPEDSKKISQNDNLVLFRGRFQDMLSEEAKSRYRYLTLLHSEQQMDADIRSISADLALLREKAIGSVEMFLALSGIAIDKQGLVVIPESTDVPSEYALTIYDALPLSPQMLSLAQIKALIAKGPEGKNDVAGEKLLALIQAYRSQKVGIGSELLKSRLQGLEDTVLSTLRSESMSIEDKWVVYQNTTRVLEEQVVLEVVQADLKQNTPNFIQLRSVRGYYEYLERYHTLQIEYQKNHEKLQKARASVADVIWFFQDKELSTNALEKQDPEAFHYWYLQAKSEWENFPQNTSLTFQAPDQQRTALLDKTFKSEEPAPNYFNWIFTLLPIALIGMLFYFIFSRQMKGMGSSAMNFSKSPAKLLNKNKVRVTFDDVAGIQEAREELEEIVDFLKDPRRYVNLGGRIPKGVLLVGLPGTGKTLIAKAVAGEAKVPFFSISGSDFVEMFVGVGASRVRDMFDQARKSAPCIIFIDEIDAVGRHRGTGIGGGHDEREQTLNQLLTEMDGITSFESVIVIAATNRADVLDKALLRPGRFDRQVHVELPDIKGRYEVLKVHARKLKLDPNVDLQYVARGTPGASGAVLANLLNEAALIAARKHKKVIDMEDIKHATAKALFGKERRTLELTEADKKHTAYHESGHAVVGLVLGSSDPVDRVTIIPRGSSLGATYFLPERNRVSYWKKELYIQLAVLMGGRVAEDLFIHDSSSGAQMDFKQATALAKAMVCEWGMSEKVGPVALGEERDSKYFVGVSEKAYSEKTAEVIDAELNKILEDAYNTAKRVIEENREKMEIMTAALLEFETLDREDVLKIMSGSWSFDEKRHQIEEIEKKSHKLPPPLPTNLNGGESMQPAT